MTDPNHPDYQNNLVAAGAIFMALSSAPGARVDVVVDDDGNATNELSVEFDFLASPYRFTVEREVLEGDPSDE